MALRFTVLASGSAGNASYLEADGFGLLLDVGLGPRQLARRLAADGASWHQIGAVVLSHIHSDHWKDATLAHLLRQRIPLWCHPEHHAALLAYGGAFAGLLHADLVRTYEPGREFAPAAGLRCRALPLRHDAGGTFGFRIEGASDLFHPPWALAYAADLGSWSADLPRELADADVLALEFNHDVRLERSSGRNPRLIARVLGDHGHLSNEQAATLLREVLHLSAPGRVRHVVQLHLSRDCNRPALAADAARLVLAEFGNTIRLHTACQDQPGPMLVIDPRGNGARRSRSQTPVRPASRSRKPSQLQRWLPGLEGCDPPPADDADMPREQSA